jgi:hypothetical protein
MERVETIVYGEPSKGGLIERLNTVEKDLFGRDLPGSIAARHSGILNFLEVGTPDQPSMLFKLGVAEWAIGQTSQEQKAALKRVEDLEIAVLGEMRYGSPLSSRVEQLLDALLADADAEAVTFQEVILPNATVLRVQFLEDLGPAKTKKGDVVGLALTEDLLVDKVLVSPKGSLVHTVVKDVKQPRRMGFPSEMSFDFRYLMTLGPQRPPVTVGKAAEKAAEEAQKGKGRKDRGEGALIGAGALSLGSALVLGPVGLITGVFIKGSAINVSAGDVTFVETSGDVRVSGYPVPESLQIDPSATIRESVVPTVTTTTTTTVTTTTGTAPPRTDDKETIELPAEQKIP